MNEKIRSIDAQRIEKAGSLLSSLHDFTKDNYDKGLQAKIYIKLEAVMRDIVSLLDTEKGTDPYNLLKEISELTQELASNQGQQAIKNIANAQTALKEATLRGWEFQRDLQDMRGEESVYIEKNVRPYDMLWGICMNYDGKTTLEWNLMTSIPKYTLSAIQELQITLKLALDKAMSTPYSEERRIQGAHKYEKEIKADYGVITIALEAIEKNLPITQVIKRTYGLLDKFYHNFKYHYHNR